MKKFIEEDRYINIIYSKNFRSSYKYKDLKLTPIYEKPREYVDELYNKILHTTKKSKLHLITLMEQNINIYQNINYFCGLYKILLYIKKNNIATINNVKLYDCTLGVSYTYVNYNQYMQQNLINIIESDFIVKYSYNIITPISNLHKNISYSQNTLYSVIFVNYLLNKINGTMMTNIILNNIVDIINNIDNTSAILLIFTYSHPVFFDIVNFISKYFKKTKMYSMKYFFGHSIYVLFSNKILNITQDEIYEMKTIIASGNIVRLYSDNSYIQKYETFFNKILDIYSQRMIFFLKLSKLKFSDDVRYDHIMNTINQFKVNALDEFIIMNNEQDDDYNNLPK